MLVGSPEKVGSSDGVGSLVRVRLHWRSSNNEVIV